MLQRSPLLSAVSYTHLDVYKRQVYADETIIGQRVAMGAGAHGFSLFVEADDLIRAYGATVADITVPE